MVGLPRDCHLEMKLSAGEAPVQSQSPVPEIAESSPMAESPVPMAETGAAEQAAQTEQKPKKSGSEKRG